MTDRAHYVLGLDGGGTGCRARLTDRAGRVLGEGEGGPATLRLGADAAWAQCMAATNMALQRAGVSASAGLIHATFGLAGVSRTAVLEAVLAKPHSFADLSIVSDAETACLGAHAGADGGIVIAGTGSNAFAIVGGQRVQIGGHGFPISDAGSGADIGLEAARAALRAHDGMEPLSPLSHDILAALGGDAARSAHWLDRATATEYAALARSVVEHGKAGDASAIRILRTAALQIGALASTLFERGAPRVALLGGLAEPLTPWLPQKVSVRLTRPLGDGVDGALFMARNGAKDWHG